MTQTKLRFSSFEDYLAYSDDTERLYELDNGELVELPPESGENVGVANFLFCQFALMIGHLRVRRIEKSLHCKGKHSWLRQPSPNSNSLLKVFSVLGRSKFLGQRR